MSKYENTIQESDYNLKLFEDNMHFPRLSLFKSKKTIILSNYFNRFKIRFSRENPKSNRINRQKAKTQKEVDNRISPLEENDISDLSIFEKFLGQNVSASGKLSKKESIDDFFGDYGTSFAKYLGIDKEQFEDSIINNKDFLVLNEFGEIYFSEKIANLFKKNSTNSDANKTNLGKKTKKMFKTEKKASITNKGALKGNNLNDKIKKERNNIIKNDNINCKKEDFNKKMTLSDIKNKFNLRKIPIPENDPKIININTSSNIKNNFNLGKSLTPKNDQNNSIISPLFFGKSFLQNKSFIDYLSPSSPFFFNNISPSSSKSNNKTLKF